MEHFWQGPGLKYYHPSSIQQQDNSTRLDERIANNSAGR